MVLRNPPSYFIPLLTATRTNLLFSTVTIGRALEQYPPCDKLTFLTIDRSRGRQYQPVAWFLQFIIQKIQALGTQLGRQTCSILSWKIIDWGIGTPPLATPNTRAEVACLPPQRIEVHRREGSDSKIVTYCKFEPQVNGVYSYVIWRRPWRDRRSLKGTFEDVFDSDN